MEINKKIKIWGVVLLVVVGATGGILLFSGRTTKLFKGSQLEMLKFGEKAEGIKKLQDVAQFGDENADAGGGGCGGGGVALLAQGNVQQSLCITVTKDPNSPAAKTVSAGINDVAKFRFSVTGPAEQSAVITKMKIKRNGGATASDIPYIGLYNAALDNKLTSAQFVNPRAGDTSEYEANMVPPLAIAASADMVVLVKAFVDQEAEENTFTLSLEAGSITTEQQITGLPVESNQMTIEAAEPPPPPPPPSAAADGVLMSPHDQPIPAGQANAGALVEVFKMKVEAGADKVKRLDRILLRREGSALETDIPKLIIKQDEDIEGEAAAIGNMYTIIFTPPPGLFIGAGATRTITVFAEISPRAANGKTFKITVNSTSDLVARVEGDIATSRPVACTGCPIQSAEFTTVAIDPQVLCANLKTTVQNEINNGRLDSEQIGNLIEEPNENGCNFNAASFSYSGCNADEPMRLNNECFTQQGLCDEFKNSLVPGFEDNAEGISALEVLLAGKNPLLSCNITVNAVREAKTAANQGDLETICRNKKTEAVAAINNEAQFKAIIADANIRGCHLVSEDICRENNLIPFEGICFTQAGLCETAKADLISSLQSGTYTPAQVAENLPVINTGTGCTLQITDIIPPAASAATGTSTPQTAAATGTTTEATGTTTAVAATPPPLPPPPPAPGGTQEITVGASLPTSQKSIIPPQQNQMVQLISIDIGATGTQAQEAKLKRIVLGYAGTFDVSKISELHLFREDGTEFGVGPFNKELTSLSKNPINGTVEIIFATVDPNSTALSTGRRLVLYGKANATTDDAGKVMKYEIKAVETDPSAFSKPLIAVAGPEIGILAAETKTVATVTPPPPPPPAVAAETEASKAKAKTTKKAKDLTKAELEQAALLAELQKTVGDLKTAAGQPQAGSVAGSAFAAGAAGAQALRPVAASPALAGSQRLIRAPERSGTGPGVLVYFGILAAVQGGMMLRKKFRSRR